MSINQDLFKQGMRRLAASVCVITTKSVDGQRMGLTATAVCSVTAEPPTLLCCLNRNNASYEMFRKNGIFAINVLCVDDQEIAGNFASRLSPEERFAVGNWGELVTGSPVLLSASASFDCRLSQIVEAGSHSIFIGEIQDVRVESQNADCLLYGDGGYGGFNTTACS